MADVLNFTKEALPLEEIHFDEIRIPSARVVRETPFSFMPPEPLVAAFLTHWKACSAEEGMDDFENAVESGFYRRFLSCLRDLYVAMSEAPALAGELAIALTGEDGVEPVEAILLRIANRASEEAYRFLSEEDGDTEGMTTQYFGQDNVVVFNATTHRCEFVA